ncbi:hypothetical protein B0H11DRAFT_2417799 [Mycena galericulata]|nr:hypothetical protein B0H11DRAFT_2417799 [Mycena galericulata]
MAQSWMALVKKNVALRFEVEVPWTTWEALRAHTAAPHTLSPKSNGCIIFIAALTPTKLLATSKHSIGPMAISHVYLKSILTIAQHCRAAVIYPGEINLLVGGFVLPVLPPTWKRVKKTVCLSGRIRTIPAPIPYNYDPCGMSPGVGSKKYRQGVLRSLLPVHGSSACKTVGNDVRFGSQDCRQTQNVVVQDDRLGRSHHVERRRWAEHSFRWPNCALGHSSASAVLYMWISRFPGIMRYFGWTVGKNNGIWLVMAQKWSKMCILSDLNKSSRPTFECHAETVEYEARSLIEEPGGDFQFFCSNASELCGTCHLGMYRASVKLGNASFGKRTRVRSHIFFLFFSHHPPPPQRAPDALNTRRTRVKMPPNADPRSKHAPADQEYLDSLSTRQSIDFRNYPAVLSVPCTLLSTPPDFLTTNGSARPVSVVTVEPQANNVPALLSVDVKMRALNDGDDSGPRGVHGDWRNGGDGLRVVRTQSLRAQSAFPGPSFMSQVLFYGKISAY